MTSSIWGAIRTAANSGGLFGARPFATDTWFVGSNAPRNGKNPATIADLFTQMKSGDVAYIAPGTYDEANLVIPATLSNITLIGAGALGSVIIDPSTEDASGLEVRANGVTLVNIASLGEDTTSAHGIKVSGANFHAYRCKFANGANQVVLGPGTAAQVTAGTYGTAADALFEECEIADGTNGVVLTATDYGAIANARFINCRFRALPTAHFEETGGTVSARFTNLLIKDCNFDRVAAGTAPTKYLSLNDDNANSGVVTGCRFPTALNSGLNLVSTALLWIGNYHTGGIATAQPS